MSSLNFDQILYNEVIYHMEMKWNRKLSDHEKNLAIEVYKWTRTNIEAEEIRVVDLVRY